MSKRKCPACGAEYDADIRFCTECGTALSETSRPKEDPPSAASDTPKPFVLDTGVIEGAIPAEPDASAFPPVDPVPPASGFKVYTPPASEGSSFKPQDPPHQEAYRSASTAPNYTTSYTPQPQPQPQAAPAPSSSYRPPYPFEDKSVKPASGWAFFGLFLLYSIPVIGWIIAIIFACGAGVGKNRNLRSFSRAYLGVLTIFAILGVLLFTLFGSMVSSSIDRILGQAPGYSATLDGDASSHAGNSASGAPSEAPTVPMVGGPFAGLPSEPFVSVLASGTYSLDFSADLMGLSVSGTQAADGDRMMVKASMFGMEVYTLQIGSTSYTISESEQLYAVSDDAVDIIELPDREDYSNLTYLGSGSETVDGVTCDYDEFRDASDTTMKFYTQNGEIYGIGLVEPTLDMTITLKIHNFSATVPSGLLEIPAGYQEVSEEELVEKSGGLGFFG